MTQTFAERRRFMHLFGPVARHSFAW